jgi:hypothetical protein
MAIGDIVGSLSSTGISGATFSLNSNPGGFFAVSGSNCTEAIDTPVGSYSIVLQAVGSGLIVTQPFLLTFSGSPSDGPMDFSVPGNIGITGALP